MEEEAQEPEQGQEAGDGEPQGLTARQKTLRAIYIFLLALICAPVFALVVKRHLAHRRADAARAQAQLEAAPAPTPVPASVAAPSPSSAPPAVTLAAPPPAVLSAHPAMTSPPPMPDPAPAPAAVPAPAKKVPAAKTAKPENTAAVPEPVAAPHAPPAIGLPPEVLQQLQQMQAIPSAVQQNGNQQAGQQGGFPKLQRIPGLSERNMVTKGQALAPTAPQGQAPGLRPAAAPGAPQAPQAKPAASPNAPPPVEKKSRPAPRARPQGGSAPPVYKRTAPPSGLGAPGQVGEQVFNQSGSLPTPPPADIPIGPRTQMGPPDHLPPPNPEKPRTADGPCPRAGWWKNPATGLCYHSRDSCLAADPNHTPCSQP